MPDYREEFEEFLKDIDSPNILIIGRTGVGKSTLINKVFGASIAPAGAGAPVTDAFTKYSRNVDDGIPITLYDSAGFETGKDKEFLRETFKFLDEKRKSGKTEQIHIAWYVIDASSARFLSFEADVIKRLNKDGIPVIIVLSQCDRADDKEIDEVAQALKLESFDKAYEVVRLAASPLLKGGNPICEPFGLDQLVDATVKHLPTAYVDAFIAAQVVNIKAKRRIAWGYISTAALLCFGAGYIPLPFTTTVSTVVSQKELGYRIAALFDYEQLTQLPTVIKDLSKSKESKVTFWTTAIADLFVGEPITSTIAGGSAATFVTIIGLTFASTFEELARKELEGRSRSEIETILRDIFWKQFDSYRSNIKIKKKGDVENLGDKYLGS